MLGPALTHLLSDLRKLPDRSKYEDSLFGELAMLEATAALGNLNYVHLSAFNIPSGRRFRMKIEAPAGGLHELGEFEPGLSSGRLLVESLSAGDGSSMGQQQINIDLGEADIVRLRCDAPNCPNKRL